MIVFDMLLDDYTRVKLDEKDGVAGSDYINANFIKVGQVFTHF